MSELRQKRKETGQDMSMEYTKGYRDALEDVWEEVRKMATKGYTSHELQIMVKSKEYASKKKIEELIAELEMKAQKDNIIEFDESENLIVGVEEAAPILSIQMKPRTSYLMKEQKPARCFEMFEKEIGKGRPGLIIARTSPIQIRETYKIGKSQVIWLTMSEKTDEGLPPSALGMDMDGATLAGAASDEYIGPSNLPGLFAYLVNFLDGNSDALVLMEGVEYLISHNEFSSVLKFIQMINEKVSARSANLLMSLNPTSWDSQKFSLIEGEMGEVL